MLESIANSIVSAIIVAISVGVFKRLQSWHRKVTDIIAENLNTTAGLLQSAGRTQGENECYYHVENSLSQLKHFFSLTSTAILVQLLFLSMVFRTDNIPHIVFQVFLILYGACVASTAYVLFRTHQHIDKLHYILSESLTKRIQRIVLDHEITQAVKSSRPARPA